MNIIACSQYCLTHSSKKSIIKRQTTLKIIHTKDRRIHLKLYSRKFTPQYPLSIAPMGEIAGYLVRPGMFDINGAYALPVGVNFTIHTHEGTACELLLFHRYEEEPYAVIPFPEEY